MKYGALSSAAGRVHLTWTVSEPPGRRTVALEWAESGGPGTTPPDHTGFGSQLLRLMASQLDGEIAFDWQPVGLRAVLRFPLGDASAVPDAAASAPDRAVGQKSASLSGKRVLVVEDAALVA